MTKQTDSYYTTKSREVIADSLRESLERGRSPEETRFHLRRAYCFGALRKGKAYKAWNKVLLAKEAELGYEPKKHQKTLLKESLLKEQVRMNSVPTKVTTKPVTKPTLVAEPPTLKVTTPDSAVSPAWAEFLKNNPRPITKELASKFLRKHCKTNLFMAQDHDKLRVVLLTSDDECETKWQFSRELKTDDAEEWDLCFMEAACQAYSVLIESQKSKY